MALAQAAEWVAVGEVAVVVVVVRCLTVAIMSATNVFMSLFKGTTNFIGSIAPLSE